MTATQPRPAITDTDTDTDTDAAASTVGAASIVGDTAASASTRLRFWLHAAALLAVLLGVCALLNNGFPANSDEGAVAAEVTRLDQGPWSDPATWRIERSFPSVDPTGLYTPLENSEIGETWYLPYAKHPAYPLLLLPAWRLAGLLGMVAVSALAVWAAALAAAAIARRVRPDLQLATMWLLGLGSPLLLDSSLLMAHALGAALLGWIVVCLLRHLERNSPLAVAGAVVGSVALVLLRSEGLLAVGAVAAVLALLSIRRTRPLRVDLSRFVPALAIGVTGAVVYVLDGAIAGQLVGVGTVRTLNSPTAGTGLVSGRVSAFWVTILRPYSDVPNWGSSVLFGCVALVLAAGVLLRVVPERRRTAIVMLVAAAGLAILRQFAPVGMVSGLVAAFPAMVLGLMFLRRKDTRSEVLRLCLGSATVAGLAIWVTSYPIGGAVEWGGRFFHLLLPLIVPFSVLGLDRAIAASGVLAPAGTTRNIARTVAISSLLIVTGSLSVLSLRTGADLRSASRTIVQAGLTAADAAAPAVDGGSPVIISDARPLGRAAWASLDDYRMLRIPYGEDLSPVLDGLADEGVGTVTVMVSQRADLPADVDERWAVVEERGIPEWNTLFLELRQR